MKFFKRKAISEIDKRTKGAIVDSENITNKEDNTYSANIIDKKIAENVPDIEIPSNYNYSTEAPAGDIDSLAAFTSGKPGMTGSISLTKKASGTGSEIPAGWYNFIFTPHRTGINPAGGGDNANYGTIILTPLNFDGASWIVRRSGSTTAISQVKKMSTLSYSDFVVEAHAVSVSLSAYNSANYTATLYKSGYYPLCIASPAAFWYNQGGFTISPQRLDSRANGSCVLAYWGKNDANGATSNCTAYVDILWVKI